MFYLDGRGQLVFILCDTLFYLTIPFFLFLSVVQEG